MCAPAGTPTALIERLHREVSAVQELPEIRKQLDNDGATVLRMTPAQFGAYMAADMEKWGRVVKAASIKANRAPINRSLPPSHAAPPRSRWRSATRSPC